MDQIAVFQGHTYKKKFTFYKVPCCNIEGQLSIIRLLVFITYKNSIVSYTPPCYYRIRNRV